MSSLSIIDSSWKMIIGKGDKLTYDGKTENFDILILDLNYLLKKRWKRNIYRNKTRNNSKIVNISWYKSDINMLAAMNSLMQMLFHLLINFLQKVLELLEYQICQQMNMELFRNKYRLAMD